MKRSILFAFLAAAPLAAQDTTVTTTRCVTIGTSRVCSATESIARATVTPPPVVVAPPVAPPVVAPPPVGGSASPDTSGMSRLTERGFSTLDTAGWYRESKPSNRVQVVQTDRGAAVQQNYLPGLPAGESPTSLGNESIAQKRIMYVSTWIRVSPNFVGHGGSVNKVLHFYTNGGNRLIFLFRGSGNGPLAVEFATQGIAQPYPFTENGMLITGSTEANLHTNLATCTVSRGQWHRYELVLTNNNVGASDGAVEWWQDGKKCASYTGITYVGAGGNNKWEGVNWSPTYGGGYSLIREPFWMQMDQIYVSGK